MISRRSRMRRLLLVASAVLLSVAALSGTSSASVALDKVVSANPADFTPNVASPTDGSVRAIYRFLQVNGVMYAGGTFTSVSTASGVSPTGTFARSNLVAFKPTTGAINSFSPRFNGPVWALASDGTSLYVGGEFTSVTAVNGTFARRGLAKITISTGALNPSFDANFASGNVYEAGLVTGRLIVGGSFPKALVALSPSAGADTGYLRLGISGTVYSTAGPTSVYRFAVDPRAHRLVAIGNFTSVGGQKRYRAFMVTLGPTATLNAWYYSALTNMCSATSEPAYLRDVDFSPDGSYFVIVSTGYIPRSGGLFRDVCDAAARFETGVTAPTHPTWINYTGGDTLHSVAVTDVAVYVQGHQRWLNNPHGVDTAGTGAVSRPGIGAIDPVRGLALSWNPTKDRGVGGKDLLVTGQGLWVGSDTTHIGGEYHARIALMPR